MRTKLRLAILCVAGGALSLPLVTPARQASATGAVIECRALESHKSSHPTVDVVVFHQSRKEDQERLGSMLRGLAGENVELQTGGEKWIQVSVFRLKSCFGRGLLVLLADAPPMQDGATFLLRFSSSAGAN